MSRKPTLEGKRITICVKVSEPMAAEIDTARGETTRAAFLAAAIDAYLAPKPRRPKTAALSPACRHPVNRRIGDTCMACHNMIAKR